jgi:hypothetical protein
MKNIIIVLVLFSFIFLPSRGAAQDENQTVIQSIYDNALSTDIAYMQLEKLCKEAPGRLIGTPNSFKAVKLMKEYLTNLGADTVFLQSFTSPAWICNSASLTMTIDGKEIPLQVDALGPCGSTPLPGIHAEIIEVMSLDEVRELGKEKIEGKIVFFNRPMNTTYFNVFKAYSEAVDQRYWGPSLAQEYGAVGSITRSANPNMDDFPHTGSCRMEGNKIPAIAISTNDAEKLSKVLKSNPQLKVNIQVDAEDITTQSYNLIADLKGSEKPDEFIIVAGHLDAWHNTEGAHDDGVGCLQSTEVLRLFKQLGLNNKRSIRVILYMDEELYQSGGNAYVAYSKEQQVMNYFAIESDAGGFSPRFFSVDAPDIVLEKIKKYESFLKPYGIEEITAGGSGVDIGPMKELGVPLSGYRTDWQRYFDMHHSANDTFDQVNFREMQLGSGAMASLVYLIDKYDLANQN